MGNKYDFEIKDKDGVHIIKDIELDKIDEVLLEYPNYESINASIKKEEKLVYEKSK